MPSPTPLPRHDGSTCAPSGRDRWLCLLCSLALGVLALPGTAAAESASSGGTRVQITSDPPGAAVYVDGGIERAGETPVTLRLRPGEHRLRLRLEGHADEEQTVEVGRSRTTLSFRLTPLGRLEVRAADDSAAGATVSVDGTEVGAVPVSEELEPGRHRVEVTREGYRPLSQWFELTGGQTYNLTVTLQADRARQGSILVAGDVSGAPVTVDGEARGTAPLIVEVEPGDHVVEIRPEGLEPYREAVSVEPGGRVTVNPTLRTGRGSGGTLRVLTEPAGAAVWVDGEEHGTGPATVEGLAAGTHIVEARQDGYRMASQEVVIEPGRQATVRLVLTAERSRGTIRVTSTAPGSEVLLDGRSLGTAPVVEEGVTAGEHLVVVRTAGWGDWEQRVTLAPGEDVSIQATPVGVGRLSVVSNVEGAEVLVDGEAIGSSPVVDHEVPAGEHVVEVRAEGREPFMTRVTLAAGAAEHVSADFEGAGAAASSGGEGEGEGGEGEGGEGEGGEGGGEGGGGGEEAPPPSRFGLSAAPLRPYQLAVDASFGWPWLVGTYRVSLGVYDSEGMGGVDVAVELRSSYWLTEIDGHVRYGIRLLRILALGAEVSIGGGFGIGGRNTFGFGITLHEGVELGRISIALRERLAINSDDYSAVVAGEGGDLPRKLRPIFWLGAAFEIRITDLFHVFAVLDYAPAQDPRQRILCGGEWRSGTDSSEGGCDHWMPGGVALEGRLGVGLRFF